MSRVKELIKKYRELITYVIFGVATTAVNWIIFFPLKQVLELNLFSMPEQLRLQAANVVSWIGAVVFSFFVNKKYVFRSRTESRLAAWREFGAFVASRFLSLLIEAACLVLGVELLSLDENLTKLAAAVIVVVFNYVAGKLLVFRKRGSTPER